RVLRPGGRVEVHGLVSDRPFPGQPDLPGLASLVRRIPVETEAADALERAGFRDLYYERLGDIHCFQVSGVELRERRLIGTKPAEDAEPRACSVIYKGPFEEVQDDEGTRFRRGQRMFVSPACVERLRRGPGAEYFAFLPQ